MHSCRLIGCKNIKGQSWRFIKNLLVQPAPGGSGSRWAAFAIFFATSNFDLKYFCSLLTYKNVQYLIWKIWFISVWSLKPKAVVWLLTGFMLGQSTLISYHTEANDCIFFATGVDLIRLLQLRDSCRKYWNKKNHQDFTNIIRRSKAVWPPSLHSAGSAPCSKSNFTNFGFPEVAAAWRHVSPFCNHHWKIKVLSYIKREKYYNNPWYQLHSFIHLCGFC